MLIKNFFESPKVAIFWCFPRVFAILHSESVLVLRIHHNLLKKDKLETNHDSEKFVRSGVLTMNMKNKVNLGFFVELSFVCFWTLAYKSGPYNAIVETQTSLGHL